MGHAMEPRCGWAQILALTAVLVAPAGTAAAAEGKDPAKETVLIGEREAWGMNIKLEIEPAQPMFMPMQGMWMEMKLEPGDVYHFEVKPEDPRSKTRLAYAAVKFRAVNTGNGKAVEKELHPMWGGSGLHYAANGALPEMGPTWQRSPSSRPPSPAGPRARTSGGILPRPTFASRCGVGAWSREPRAAGAPPVSRTEYLRQGTYRESRRSHAGRAD